QAANVLHLRYVFCQLLLFAAQAAHGASPPAAAEAPAAPIPKLHKPAARKPQPPHVTVFEKAMESLTAMFPDCSRPDLTRFVQEFRLSRGGSLNSMPLQEVVGGGAAPPLATHNPVWQRVGTQRVRTPNAVSPTKSFSKLSEAVV
ncbi:hypothetical protein XENOCAPTIV_006030, partial [Xenoophorus captivus]